MRQGIIETYGNEVVGASTKDNEYIEFEKWWIERKN